MILTRVLCLGLPRWPIQRLRAERPDLHGRPLLIHRPDARRGERVIGCCDMAERLGVRIGATLTEAVAVLKRGARRAAALVPDDPAADLVALGRLAERCEAFSPRVGWDTASPRAVDRAAGPKTAPPWFGISPGHLFLDLTGVAHLFGGEPALCEQVAAACRDAGYAPALAVAPTVGAAWAVAMTGSPLTIVPDGDLGPTLDPLAVDVLRLSVDVVDVLARLGVHTVDALRRLSRASLAERFGAAVGLRLDQAFGTAAEVIVPHRPPPVFEAAYSFEDPVDRREAIDQVVDDLLDRLAAALHAAVRGVVRLVGRLDCSPDAPVTFEVGLFRPTAAADRLRDLVCLQLERVTLPGPVSGVHLQADFTAPLEHRQGELFIDRSAAADQHLAALVERLSSRLGPRAVVRPVLCPDPLPERAFRRVPLVGLPAVKTVRPLPRRGPVVDHRVRPAPADRPLRLFAPPVQVVATAVVPHGPPVAFDWLGERHAVARCWGPERIETGWWRRGTVRRDYYRVETATGGRFWLFRDLAGDDWYLHGRFE